MKTDNPALLYDDTNHDWSLSLNFGMMLQCQMIWDCNNKMPGEQAMQLMKSMETGVAYQTEKAELCSVESQTGKE